VKRFPTYTVHISVNRAHVAKGVVVARPIGAEVNTEWPVLTPQRDAIADVLLLLLAQVYPLQEVGKVAVKLLKEHGFGEPFTIPEGSQVDDDIEGLRWLVDDDIPF